MSKEKFYNVDRNEQETNIIIDYAAKIVTVYTSRYSVYNKLLSKLSNPDVTDYVGKEIASATWRISFNDKKLARVFSKCLMIGNIK
jgi:hypothetical protein